LIKQLLSLLINQQAANYAVDSVLINWMLSLLVIGGVQVVVLFLLSNNIKF